MASTTTQTRVRACVWARSMTWVANELLRVLSETVQMRGLPMDYLHNNMETLTMGFRTWIIGHYLSSVVLEIWDGQSNVLIEAYDLGLDYERKPSQGEKFETHIGKLEQQIAARAALNPGCAYRVVVKLKDGAPRLPGWSATNLRDTSHLKRHDIGDIIDTTHIGVSFSAWF